MRVREVMSSPPVTVTPATTVQAAARLLQERGFALLPVVDDDGGLVGVVTEVALAGRGVVPDQAQRLVPQCFVAGRPPATVAEVMTSPALTAAADDDLTHIARLLLSQRLRALPVTERGRLVGIVARRDLLAALARSA